MKLLITFDETKSGSLTVPEFFAFLKFMYLLQSFKQLQIESELIEGVLRVHDLPDLIENDKAAVKKHIVRLARIHAERGHQGGVRCQVVWA